MSRDNAPKYNIETINTKTNTVTKLVRSFRNDKDGDNRTQVKDILLILNMHIYIKKYHFSDYRATQFVTI